MTRFSAWLCDFGLHRWSKWQTSTRREVHREQVTGKVLKDVEIWKFQYRNCETCGLYERRDFE